MIQQNIAPSPDLNISDDPNQQKNREGANLSEQKVSNDLNENDLSKVSEDPENEDVAEDNEEVDTEDAEYE